MKFLVDTNLGRKFANLLKNEGYDVVFAKDLIPLFKDEELLEKAENEGRIVVTNDKDFGELIFRLDKPTSGVVLLRTPKTNFNERFELVRDVLGKATGKFIVVKEGQVRIRDLK